MSKSVLSIQSHVVHGYVGGKAAIFPLQTQGWEVDNINTVNFSNHTGYGSFKGNSIDENDELNPILNQLINNLHINYNAILTGYIPNSNLINCIGKYVKQVKEQDDKVLYLLDPVMGDNNYLYVSESCITEYQNLLTYNMIDIITPNQFELELLSNNKITDLNTLKLSILKLHLNFNIKYIVITSLSSSIFNPPDNEDTESNKQDDKFIYCACSTLTNLNQIQIFKIPIIKSYFTGVGDLFSALLLDKLYNNIHSITTTTTTTSDIEKLTRSVNQVLTIMSKTLKLTHSIGLKEFNKHKSVSSTTNSSGNIIGKINDADSMKYFELKIIESRSLYDYCGDGAFKPELLKVDY
ncbi:Ribokinase-like protein [Scheffersomyces coipomensis]|uniref:Ribokinase-like protein n=1 Tax=Scheffersomyces coipomensis TaxID=1788519 RepID=UPI00315C848C